MFTGRRFRLKSATLGIEGVSDERIATLVPAGEIIVVLSGPRPDDKRMLDVCWGDHRLVMFAEDVARRGEEIPGVSVQ